MSRDYSPLVKDTNHGRQCPPVIVSHTNTKYAFGANYHAGLALSRSMIMAQSIASAMPSARNVLNMLGERFACISGAKTGAALASADSTRMAANL